MKKNHLVTIFSVMLLVVALIGSLFLDDVLGSKISNVVTIITAIIGAIALFIQFKKDKEINQASFILEYAKEFRNIDGYNEVVNVLEQSRKNPKTNIEFDKNYTYIVAYLQWVETLASLVKNKMVTIAMIDDLLSYNVFLILNNKEIQEKEIIPCKEFYRGTYVLYDEWYKYKIKNNLSIINEKTGLEKTEGYNEYISEILNPNKKK